MIYILDEDPAQAAVYLPDEQIIRAIPLVAQMLCEAHVIRDGWSEAEERFGEEFIPCKLIDLQPWPTDFGKWAASHVHAFAWLRNYGVACLHEYVIRFRRSHPLDHLLYWCLTPDLPTLGTLPAPPCSGYYGHLGAVESHRRLLFETSKRPHWPVIPDWWSDMVTKSLKELVA